MSGRAWRLAIAAAVFLGWLGWLGYAALSKSRAPVVSRAQASATTHPVVAEVQYGGEGKPGTRVKVVQSLTEKGPAADTELFVPNLTGAAGYVGPGQDLLLLMPDPQIVKFAVEGRELPAYAVVGQQRSPGFDLAGVGPPLIYRWSPDVEAQALALFR
jgi:hypothetical protein